MKFLMLLMLTVFTIACATVDGPEREVASDDEDSQNKRQKPYIERMYDRR